MRFKTIALFVMGFVCCEAAIAACIYNGVAYPTGTVLGPYVCNGDQWVRR